MSTINSATSTFDQDDLRRLNLTQTIRENAITDILGDRKLPTSQEDREILLKLLDGMDRTALSKTKIKSDEQSNKAHLTVNNMIVEALKRVGGSSTSRVRTEEIMIPGTIEESTIVFHERHIGIEQLDYDSFMKST